MRLLDRAPLTSPWRNNEQPLTTSYHFKPRPSNGLLEKLAVYSASLHCASRRFPVCFLGPPCHAPPSLTAPLPQTHLFSLPQQPFQTSCASQHGADDQNATEPRGQGRVAPSMPCPRCVTCLVWWRWLGLGGRLIIHTDRLS